jgi:ubiquinone/menaquinone biosynthesis C-methylase UbiE
MENITSWGKVADWYDDLLSGEGTYQKEVILPNLLRIATPLKGKKVLDLACGQGFFTKAFYEAGAEMSAVDISAELILLALAQSPKEIKYFVSPADKLDFAGDKQFDLVINVLAIQNIKEVDKVFAELFRVVKPAGKLIIVMNHPAFRVPKHSAWGWNEKGNVQFRQLDSYMSESAVPIVMNPGQEKSAETLSFHRPLQYYFKLFSKYGFKTVRLEEWISNKKSDMGPRKSAEDKARKEFPLFLCLQLERN